MVDKQAILKALYVMGNHTAAISHLVDAFSAFAEGMNNEKGEEIQRLVNRLIVQNHGLIAQQVVIVDVLTPQNG